MSFEDNNDNNYNHYDTNYDKDIEKRFYASSNNSIFSIESRDTQKPLRFYFKKYNMDLHYLNWNYLDPTKFDEKTYEEYHTVKPYYKLLGKYSLENGCYLWEDSNSSILLISLHDEVWNIEDKDMMWWKPNAFNDILDIKLNIRSWTELMNLTEEEAIKQIYKILTTDDL